MGRYLDLAMQAINTAPAPGSSQPGADKPDAARAPEPYDINDLNDISSHPDPLAREQAIARWLWEHPPENPDPDHCAACGASVGPDVAGLRVLGDGAVVCYGATGGGLRCWWAYQERRRAQAEQALYRSGEAE